MTGELSEQAYLTHLAVYVRKYTFRHGVDPNFLKKDVGPFPFCHGLRDLNWQFIRQLRP